MKQTRTIFGMCLVAGLTLGASLSAQQASVTIIAAAVAGELKETAMVIRR